MNVPLSQILSLVGRLDDQAGDDTPRERFRHYLSDNVRTIGQARDYIEECLRGSGEQYNRALQDLTNHLGSFLGFKVKFGRYQGSRNDIGFDGHWVSPKDTHLVVEVKTSEVYPIRAATLVSYVDDLISAKQIPNWDNALGLYVVGRPDPDIQQLQNAIIAEKRTHQLRTISVESLISLAEIMDEYDVNHEDVLAILRPSGPTIDPLVDLMARLAVASQEVDAVAHEFDVENLIGPMADVDNISEATCWLTPVKSEEEATADDVVRVLVGQENVYAFGERTSGRNHIQPGDHICFYASGKGVVADARIASYPEKRPHPKARQPDRYPWTFKLEAVRTYLDNPVVIDSAMRARLNAFEGRDPNTYTWGWFVQTTRKLTMHDFALLTRQTKTQ